MTVSANKTIDTNNCNDLLIFPRPLTFSDLFIIPLISRRIWNQKKTYVWFSFLKGNVVLKQKWKFISSLDCKTSTDTYTDTYKAYTLMQFRRHQLPACVRRHRQNRIAKTFLNIGKQEFDLQNHYFLDKTKLSTTFPLRNENQG